MAITILAPAPSAAPYEEEQTASEESEDGGAGLGEDTELRPAKRARHSTKGLVTPGETVTDDPQWMRYVTPSSLSVHWFNRVAEAMGLSLRPRAQK
jgi:exosome complex component RRP4